MDQTAEIPKLMTVSQVAELLAVTPKHVYYLVNTGKLRALRPGGVLRLSPADVLAYLDSTATTAPQQ